ncbi:hypothetical protein Cgig2_009011 [Carnegiea gigantea]|uniref:Uncharacterized protein n=1 Tax=Carnegiea gigantea TaxID=171969 RepID=A0A9Q1QIS0_9CARY|nr:hypothetical protein Cgig2_009011 [Carnegiea gigantea]
MLDVSFSVVSNEVQDGDFGIILPHGSLLMISTLEGQRCYRPFGYIAYLMRFFSVLKAENLNIEYVEKPTWEETSALYCMEIVMWSLRGLNDPPKHPEVSKCLSWKPHMDASVSFGNLIWMLLHYWRLIATASEREKKTRIEDWEPVRSDACMSSISKFEDFLHASSLSGISQKSEQNFLELQDSGTSDDLRNFNLSIRETEALECYLIISVPYTRLLASGLYYQMRI